MELSRSTLIGLVAIAGLAFTVLFMGVKVWNGDEYERFGPLIKNGWTLLAALAALAAAVSLGAYLMFTGQLRVGG